MSEAALDDWTMIVAFRIFIVQAIRRYYSGEKLFENLCNPWAMALRWRLLRCLRRASTPEPQELNDER